GMVLPPGARRGQVDSNCRQSRVQVLAQVPLPNGAIDVRLDAGDRPHIHDETLTGFSEHRVAPAEHAGEPRLHARRGGNNVAQVTGAADSIVQAAGGGGGRVRRGSGWEMGSHSMRELTRPADPKSSRSSSSGESAAQSTVTKRDALGRCLWIASATTRRPVPLSPRIMTPARCSPACAARMLTSRIDRDKQYKSSPGPS